MHLLENKQRSGGMLPLKTSYSNWEMILEAGIEADAKFPSVLSVQMLCLISQAFWITRERRRETLQELCPEHPNAVPPKAAGGVMLSIISPGIPSS